MKRKTILGFVVIVIIASVAIFAGCSDKGEITPSTQTAKPPDPYVRFGTLGTGLESRRATQYHWQSGILSAATINVVVENRGGAGSVAVIFEVENEEIAREIVHLESGEEKQITITIPLSKYGYESVRELKVNVTASSAQ